MWLVVEDSLNDEHVDEDADNHPQQLGDGKHQGAPGGLLVHGQSLYCVQCEDRLVRKMAAVGHVGGHHGHAPIMGRLFAEKNKIK